MKVFIFIAILLSAVFCDDVKITCEDRIAQWNDLVYCQKWNGMQLTPYTTEIKTPNDTTYTVVNKDGEYIIIREYKKVDTLKVKIK